MSGMGTANVERAALQMLVAAGKAVLASSQSARIADRSAPDLAHQVALRNAITLAERALLASFAPNTEPDAHRQAAASGGESA